MEINGNIRIPDFFDEANGIIAESKNVKHLSYTSQLRDYVDKAKSMKTTLKLYVRSDTTFSKPLQRVIDQGLVTIERFSW